MEALLGMRPLDIELKVNAMKAYCRLKISDRWTEHVTPRFTKRMSHMEFCSNIKDMFQCFNLKSDKCVTERKPYRGYNITIPTREEWENDPSGGLSASDCINCYTDGSKFDNGSGAAGIIFWNAVNMGSSTKLYEPRGVHASIFQAEIVAITKVAESLIKNNTRNKVINIYSDSQAGLLALKRVNITSLVVKECLQVIDALRKKGNHMNIKWIPGHKGFIGNESADEIAKKAAETIPIGPEPILPIPHNKLTSIFQSWGNDEFKRQWANRPDCVHSKRFITTPNVKPNKILIKLSRKRLRQLTGVITGHIEVQKHLHKIGISDTSLCQKCNEEEETVEHFLFKCPKYYQQRIITWNTNTLTYAQLNDKNWTSIQYYLKETGRFDN